jgi:hypothetical protein
MEKISWTDHVRNEEVLHTVKKRRNILHTIKKEEKGNGIGHMLRRDWLLKRVIEPKRAGRMEVMGKRRRRTQPTDDLMEMILEIEGRSMKSHCEGNLLWNRLQTCHKTDYRTKECHIIT